MVKLEVIDGPSKGETFDLNRETMFLGRSSKNDVQIIDPRVSRMHLKIFRVGNSIFVEDLKSSNGTFLNGRFLEPGEGYQVDEGDSILVGIDTRLRVVRPDRRERWPVEEIFPSPVTFSVPLPEGTPADRRSRSLREVRLVSSVSELLKTSTELKAFIDKMLGTLLKTFQRIDRAAVFLRGRGTEPMREFIRLREPGERNLTLPWNREAVDQVLRERKAVVIADTANGGSHGPADSGDTLEIRSMVGLPIVEGLETCGVLYLDGIRGSHAVREEDLLTLRALCGLIALAVRNAEISSRLSAISRIAVRDDTSSPHHEKAESIDLRIR